MTARFFANPFELFWLDGVTTDNYIYVMFQMTFAIITAALISGAVADRLKFSAWVVFLPAVGVIVYFPMAHMVFSCTEDSLICGRIGAQDYAGGTAVHINAGVAALVLVLLLGKRIGLAQGPDAAAQPDPDHARRGHAVARLVRLQRRLDRLRPLRRGPGRVPAQFYSETGRTFANTTLADAAPPSSAGCSSSGCCTARPPRWVPRPASWRAWSPITPAAGAVDIEGAVAIGLIAGAVCAWAVGLKYRLGYDDSLDVVGVHLVGGIIGTVLIGFFSTSDGAGGIDGLFYGGGSGSLGDQTLGVLVAVAYSGVLTAVIALAIKYTIGLRLDEEDEVNGIDLAAHGESAYDLHSGSGGGAPASWPPSTSTHLDHGRSQRHEARDRGHQAAQVGGRPRGARDLRRHRHDRLRRSAATAARRATPRSTAARSTTSPSCPRSGSRSSSTTRTPRTWSASSSRPRRPAGSATARSGSARSRPWSGSAPATATKLPSELTVTGRSDSSGGPVATGRPRGSDPR